MNAELMSPSSISKPCETFSCRLIIHASFVTIGK